MHNIKNSTSFKKIFKQIGKIYLFSCILYRYYSPKFDQVFLQTIDSISAYGEIGFGQNFDSLANKTVLFMQDIVTQNMILRQNKMLNQSKPRERISENHNLANIEESEEPEQRLSKLVSA